MSAIRIVVADDHTLMRSGIVGLLNAQPDMEVVGEAGNGKEVLATVAEALPDVALMDIGMPGVDGLQATRIIKERHPDIRVLMLTMHEREDYLFRALRAGASGYILKGADVQDLLTAIRVVHGDEVYLHPTLTKTLLSDYLARMEPGEEPRRYGGLTEREREVLELIADGNTNNKIAEILFLSPHTVQTHRDHIMKKLDLHNKAELIKYAIRKGFVSAES